MKTKTLVLAAIMFLGMGAAAFAQGTFSVGSIPVTAVINTGLTELTGAITFNLTGGTAVLGTFTVNYGVPITVPFATVTVTSVPAGAAVNTATSSNSGGVLVINVPAGTTSVTISGVRVAVAGTTLTSLSASISGTGNAITAGQTSVQVISSIAAGIASVNPVIGGAATNVPGVVNATTGVVTSPGPSPAAITLTVREGFLAAWDLGSGIRITLSQAPPVGITLAFGATATTIPGATWTQVACDMTAIAPVTVTSTSVAPIQICYQETAAGATSPTTQEYVSIPVTLTSAPTAAQLPLTTGPITFTATMAPIGTAFSSTGGVLTTLPAGYIPRFTAAEVGPGNLVTFVGTTTTLLIPFAQVVSAAGYDTGIAIANTTTDPGTPTGFTSPVKQTGTITFYFYPQAVAGTLPASFSYTTSASSPGSGLNASGQVASGSTYVVLLSQLLAAASKGPDFSGSIFAIGNFTNAHGLYVISNFSTFSQGAMALVVNGPRNVAAEALSQ